MNKEQLYKIIDDNAKDFEEISDAVWDYAELCFEEVKSSKLQMEYMKKAGFRIKTPVAGMKTAFIAEYGSGKPILAMLGENDALPNQSQVADLPAQKAIIEGGSGHACGHNLHGTGAIEGVCALKRYMELNNIPGTLRYYACPAEEGGGGKVYMCAAGVFDDVDACVAWHPFAKFSVPGKHLALVTFDLVFHGKAAHASAVPWNGRSALDALELTNVGIQFLREHVTTDSRIHYAILDAGGQAPNVVQHTAKGRYCVRGSKADYVEELFERVVKIARGAAMMTETQLDDPHVTIALKSKLSNAALDQLLVDNITSLLPLKYTQEELAYAKEFQKYGLLPDAPTPIDYDFHDERLEPSGGSSDCSDVSHVTAMAQLYACCAPVGAISHGWTTTAVGKSSIAKRGMHTAAKALAGTLLDLYTHPELLAQVRRDFEAMRKDKVYHTMMSLDGIHS